MSSSPVKVTVRVVRDTKLHGLQELAGRLRHGKGGAVLVGVPAGAKEEDGTSLAKIAAIHEFGSGDGKIPERSFLRSAIRANLQAFRALNLESLKAILEGKMDEAKALGRLGQLAVARVKQQIRNGTYVPLKPSTIQRKGSSKPLIDTGHLLQSINYQLDDGQVALREEEGGGFKRRAG